MLEFLGLTTSLAVRAVLGLDETELPDSSFLDMGVEEDLEADLDEWTPEPYVDIISKGSAPGASDIEIKNLRLLKQYAKYKVAQSFLVSLPAGAAVKISDGHNVFNRSSDFISLLSDSIYDRLSNLKQILRKSYGLSSSMNLVSSVTPSYDPVTGT